DAEERERARVLVHAIERLEAEPDLLDDGGGDGDEVLARPAIAVGDDARAKALVDALRQRAAHHRRARRAKDELRRRRRRRRPRRVILVQEVVDDAVAEDEAV